MPFDQQVTFLYTDDLEAGHRFWGAIMGLEMVLDQGACRIYRAAPNAFVGVCSHRGPPADPRAAMVTLVTDDVDGWHARLVARGADILQPPQDNAAFNIRHCFLRDPAGYGVEIQQFRDPAWPTPE